MSALPLQLFLLFATLVEEKAGLRYEVDDLPLFADKLQARVTAAGFDSALDYYYFLRYDPGGSTELDALVDVLVVNETYLFREVDALSASIEHVIRNAIAERGVARVWSAGCATGEEPFTLAMMLAEAGLLDRVELVATDISSRALAKARSGKISSRGVRSLLSGATAPPPLRARARPRAGSPSTSAAAPSTTPSSRPSSSAARASSSQPPGPAYST